MKRGSIHTQKAKMEDGTHKRLKGTFSSAGLDFDTACLCFGSVFRSMLVLQPTLTNSLLPGLSCLGKIKWKDKMWHIDGREHGVPKPERVHPPRRRVITLLTLCRFLCLAVALIEY